MIERRGKAFAFVPKEIGCVDPLLTEPMVIFTILHVPKAYVPRLIAFLKEKVSMGILEPSNAPYSNRWFTVPKKNRSLRFIRICSR
jgi:hypothetical protein